MLSGTHFALKPKYFRNMTKRLLWTASAVALVLAGAGTWRLKASPPPPPSLPAPNITPNLIIVNIPTEITATISIPEPTLDPTTVYLTKVTPDGSSTTVAPMVDNGHDGDLKPGDKTFTAHFSLNPSTVGEIRLVVSAEFTGRTNQFSEPAVINVWSQYEDPRLTVLVPPIMSPASLPDGSGYNFLVVSPSTHTALSSLFISAPTTTDGLAPAAWFRDNWDPMNLLMSSGAISQAQQSNGATVIKVSGIIPVSYTDQYGPVPFAFVFSPGGDKVISLMEGQEDPLPQLGYSEEHIAQIFTMMMSTISIH